MDSIYVSRLPLLSLVGVYLNEKENPQPLYLDLEIKISLKQAAESDDLGDTLDYSTLCHNLQTAAAEDHCNLIERRLNDLLEIVFWDSRVHEVTGRLYKPGAVPGAEISVERTLRRSA